MRQILEARLGRPRLVRETSRKRGLATSPLRLLGFIVALLLGPFVTLARVVGFVLRWLRRLLKRLFRRLRKAIRRRPNIPRDT